MNDPISCCFEQRRNLEERVFDFEVFLVVLGERLVSEALSVDGLFEVIRQVVRVVAPFLHPLL